MTADDIPRPLPFERRVKSIEPMPGGQTAYLESLRQVCNRVDKQSMSRAKLSDWLSERFGIGVSYARNVESFLRRTGFLDERLGVLRLSEATRAWLASGDDRIPVSVLHSRIRFVGDMLASCVNPSPRGNYSKLPCATGYRIRMATPSATGEAGYSPPGS